MEIINIIKAEPSHLDWIFQLADKNSKENVKDKSKGYVQTANKDLFAKWIDLGLISVITVDSQPAGFGVLQIVHESKMPGPPILQYILTHTDEIFVNEKPLSLQKWALYGPVLVDESFRKRGLAGKLLAYFIAEAQSAGCNTLIAFVEKNNQASIKAHIEGLGMSIVTEVTVEDTEFVILANPL